MTINKYLPFAFIYFFINALGLPFGLTYTALLSPLLYWWVTEKRQKETLLPFLIVLSPFIINQLINGVDLPTFSVSIVNYLFVYIFCQAFYSFLTVCEDKAYIFRRLLIANFILCLVAIPLYFTRYNDILWMENNISEGIENFKRLKLFSYEASYYALLFTPLFFFFFVQLILCRNKINSWILLLMLALPYALSFSIGVIGSVLLACLLTYIIHFKRLAQKRRIINLLLLMGTFAVAGLVMLWLFFPGNSFFLRVSNILAGKDSSGNGRTSDAFILALQMLKLKSAAWGIGAGQVKLLGADIVRSYYLYDLDYSNIAIPNAVAETLAIFGWIGLILRMLLEIALFFLTSVWKNYFRLLLFLFIFIYQFTGSFITNIAEYVIWILAFTNVFKEFDVRLPTSKESIIK